jgi:hypothetical protein
MFDYDTKEEEHQNTRQSDLYPGADAPSYKSDSLVFRCSFYYLINNIKSQILKKSHVS